MTMASVGRACVLATLAAGLAGCAAVGGHVTGGNALSPSAVLATIPVGVPPTLLAISPDGSRVFAASSGQLAIIDTTTNTATVSVAIPPYTTGVTVTPDGARVLVDGVRATRLVVVDAANGSRLPPIDLVVDIHPGGFGRIAVSADGRRAYVTNQPKEYLAQVDLTTRTTTERSLDLRPSDVTLGQGRSHHLRDRLQGVLHDGNGRAHRHRELHHPPILRRGAGPLSVRALAGRAARVHDQPRRSEPVGHRRRQRRHARDGAGRRRAQPGSPSRRTGRASTSRASSSGR